LCQIFLKLTAGKAMTNFLTPWHRYWFPAVSNAPHGRQPFLNTPHSTDRLRASQTICTGAEHENEDFHPVEPKNEARGSFIANNFEDRRPTFLDC
jgi:hypothetical protein